MVNSRLSVRKVIEDQLKMGRNDVSGREEIGEYYKLQFWPFVTSACEQIHDYNVDETKNLHCCLMTVDASVTFPDIVIYR